MAHTQPNEQAITLSIRVGHDVRDQLEALAEATGRTKSFLAAEAIAEFLTQHAWQVEAIYQAIQDSDSSKATFADDEDVGAWLQSWGSDDEQDAPKCK